MSKFRSYLEKAYEIQNGSTKNFLDFRTAVMKEIGEIESDRYLNTDGKLAKKAELKAKRGIELMQKAHTMRQEFVTNLKKAYESADKTIHAALKKPDSGKVERFSKEFKQLKTELLLATRADTAERKLNDFINKINDPYFANMVRDDFNDILSPVLAAAGPDAAKYKLKLAQTFEKLQNDFESEEIKDARRVLEASESMLENPKVFGLVVQDSANGLVGGEVGRFINDTDSFFAIEKYESYRPADYVHPEDTPEAKRQRVVEETAEKDRQETRDLFKEMKELERKLKEPDPYIEFLNKRIAELDERTKVAEQ